jgi:excisionase family DNA binding protein
MTLLDRLRQLAAALPPGSSVSLPRDWLLAELDAAPASDALVADLTVEQLAQFIGKRPSTVRGWLEAGRFPGAYKLSGKAWRVPRGAVEAFQAREREGQAPEPGPNGDRSPGQLGAWRDVRRG